MKPKFKTKAKTVDGVVKDNEYFVEEYLKELKEYNIILDYKCQPRTYRLAEDLNEIIVKSGKNQENNVVLNKLVSKRDYTPDFEITWNKDSKYLHKFIRPFYNYMERSNKYPFILSDFFLKDVNDIATIKDLANRDLISIIETKSSYDFNNMTRLFELNQSQMYEHHKLYVNLIKVPDIFKKTFTPYRYTLTDTENNFRSLKYDPVPLVKYINFTNE